MALIDCSNIMLWISAELTWKPASVATLTQSLVDWWIIYTFPCRVSRNEPHSAIVLEINSTVTGFPSSRLKGS